MEAQTALVICFHHASYVCTLPNVVLRGKNTDTASHELGTVSCASSYNVYSGLSVWKAPGWPVYILGEVRGVLELAAGAAERVAAGAADRSLF